VGYTIRDFDTIVSDMVAYIVAHSSQITDLNPGSVIRSFCEGTGLTVEELYIGVYLGFRRYLSNIKTDVFGFAKKAGVKATTNVVFHRAGSSGYVTIPSGTKVQTVSGLKFATTAQIQILNGENDSDPVEVEAEKVGVAYNVATDTITIMIDIIDGVDSVTNANAAVGGVDRETEYEFEKRFQVYIEGIGRTNVAGVVYGALSVDGITSASANELFPPVANVNVKLYIDDGSAGGVSSAKVDEVQAVIDGDGENEAGYRSAGVNVLVVAPSIVTQNVTMSVTVASGVDVDQMKVDINTALTNYVNTLGIGADIVYNELIAAAMSVYGVVDCDITVPAANVTISSSEVGRLATVAISV